MFDDPSLLVAERLKAVRNDRGLTLRDLANASGLSINTISLIERGKTSPTVATLHKLATALGVTIADFVQGEAGRDAIFLKREQRQRARSVKVLIESLGTGLAGQTMEPLLITLEPGADSGPEPIMHFGEELVFCLEGRLAYEVSGDQYLLEPGDSLLFEASLPHCWHNEEPAPATAILILQSPGSPQTSSRGHF
jgi:transcriptional regulator with XRE-family HTH domain